MDRVSAGDWWRVRPYEIRGGYIRPASKAKIMRYDPWDRRREVVSYKGLLELVDGLGATAAFDPDGAEAERIVDWCNRYGLLGILPHELLGAKLHPRFGDVGFKKLVPVQQQFVRTSKSWRHASIRILLSGGRTLLAGKDRQGEPVPIEHLSEKDRPKAYTQRRGTFEYELQSVGKAFGRYFPDVAEVERDTFQYPMPLSDEFWSRYAEPVLEFVTLAVTFRNAVRMLVVRDSDQSSRQHAAETLSALASPGGQFLADNARWRWACTSLISSFASMAMQDLSIERLKQCPVCGRVFAADAYQATYCSVRCRNTALKRRYREKKKKARRPGKRARK